MNREVHVRFWESPEVKVLRATRQQRRSDCASCMSACPPMASALLHHGIDVVGISSHCGLFRRQVRLSNSFDCRHGRRLEEYRHSKSFDADAWD